VTEAAAPQTVLARELAHAMRLHELRLADNDRARALARLASWQASRMAATYADLAAQPRYADAIAFFRSDLYGEGDFAQRDADLARVVPIMVRLLPARLITTLAQGTELSVLSQELDQALLSRMPRADGVFTIAEYCAAYREPSERAAREHQIALIGEVGAGLDIYVRRPFIESGLSMMRQPARLAGLAALQDFLERGVRAFRKLHGAKEFLATIDRRERAILDAIFNGDEAPFPEPEMPSQGVTKRPPRMAGRG
jgi:hypothetical protein